jgi:hypothetical protein
MRMPVTFEEFESYLIDLFPTSELFQSNITTQFSVNEKYNAIITKENSFDNHQPVFSTIYFGEKVFLYFVPKN